MKMLANKSRLISLGKRVKLIVFRQKIACPRCVQIEREIVEQYHISKIPATVVESKKD